MYIIIVYDTLHKLIADQEWQCAYWYTYISKYQYCFFCCFTGEVYAIGGYNGVKTVDVVEKYNPDDGTWKEVSPLVFGRSVPGIAVAYLWPVQSTMKSFWEPESQL